ncbi:MAG: hypothetical protein AAFP89_23735 [Bacteroidota bacterium]
MPHRIIRSYPIGSLALLAILCGLLWRLEVEYQGWAGLKWVSYFHWAAPLGLGLFMLWGNAMIDIDTRKRVFLNILIGIYGIILYAALVITSRWTLGRWILPPQWPLMIVRYSLFILIPLIPLGAYLIMRVFRMHLPWRILLLSMAGYLLAMPLSVWILEILDHKGGADVIHTIKSGVLIPFWVFALGWLVIKKRDTDKRISL